MDHQDGRDDTGGEVRANTPKYLDSNRDRRPHQGRRRANGGAALEPRPEDPCPPDAELDPGTKRMCDLLIDMAFAKLMKQAGPGKVAEER